MPLPDATDIYQSNSIDHVFKDVFAKLDDESKAHVLHALVDLADRQVLVNTLDYISPKLKRDPFAILPSELSLKILSYIDSPRTLSRASQVSRLWHLILSDDLTWKSLCQSHHYRRLSAATITSRRSTSSSALAASGLLPREKDLAGHRNSFGSNVSGNFDIPQLSSCEFNEGVTKRPHPTSYKSHFRIQYLQNSEWEHGGRLAAKYVVMSGRRVVTALIMTDKHIVASLDDSNIYVFRPNGQLIKTLIGNVMGVWALALRGDILISGGCDKDVRVWDLAKFQCTQILHGHQSTVRCLKIVSDRIAVSGARDNTVRVWDIVDGTCKYVLDDHESSVRCLEAVGDICVSGSYDFTAKVWNINTGQLLHTLRGHESQIYSLAFDGKRIVTGSLDMTARVWDPVSGQCLAILRGHTSLVGHVQMLNDTLVSGGSDGTLRVWDLNTFACLQRIAAHDNSVTTLQFDNERIVSGGSDGNVEVWELKTGRHIRTLSGPFSAVWCIAFRDDMLMIAASQEDRIHMELVSFVPPLPYDPTPRTSISGAATNDTLAPSNPSNLESQSTPSASASNQDVSGTPGTKQYDYQHPQGATSPYSLSHLESPQDNPFDVK